MLYELSMIFYTPVFYVLWTMGKNNNNDRFEICCWVRFYINFDVSSSLFRAKATITGVIPSLSWLSCLWVEGPLGLLKGILLIRCVSQFCFQKGLKKHHFEILALKDDATWERWHKLENWN